MIVMASNDNEDLSRILERMEATLKGIDRGVDMLLKSVIEKERVGLMVCESKADHNTVLLEAVLDKLTVIEKKLDRILKAHARLEETVARLSRIADTIEEAGKSLDSRLEGRMGSILSQVQDVRRYCLDVRRECRRGDT